MSRPLLLLLSLLVASQALEELKICCRHANKRRLKACSPDQNALQLSSDFDSVYSFFPERLRCTRIIDVAHEVLPNRSILVPSDGKLVEEGDYCLEPGPLSNFTVIKCAVKHIKVLKLPEWVVFSVPLLVLTLLVLIKSPDGINMHGKCLFMYILSLLLNYSALALTNFALDRTECYNERRRGHPICSQEHFCDVLGYIVCFFSLCFTFWLNVMCIDMYRSFSNLMIGLNQDKLFKKYLLYAWGAPALLMGTCLVLDLVPGIPDFLRPNVNVCYLENWWPFYAFLFGPKTILLAVNGVLFLITALAIRKIQRSVRRSIGKAQSHAKFRYTMYIKMFILSGVTWLLEQLIVVTSRLDFYFTYFHFHLQAVLIFVFVITNQNVLQILKSYCSRSPQT